MLKRLFGVPVVIGLTVLIGCGKSESQPPGAKDDSPDSQRMDRAAGSDVSSAGQDVDEESETVDSQASHLPGNLVGTWQRSDGTYQIVITGLEAGGKLAAQYLNPRSINVSRAEHSILKGKLHVVVELQDVGYPGSYYSLDYDPESDRLIGTYFQATAVQSYEVIFVRGRSQESSQ